MPTFAKALVAAVLAGLGSLATALADNGVTSLEVTLIASSTIAAGAAVYGIKNGVGADAPAGYAEDGDGL